MTQIATKKCGGPGAPGPPHYLTALHSRGYGLADLETTAINQAAQRANKQRQ